MFQKQFRSTPPQSRALCVQGGRAACSAAAALLRHTCCQWQPKLERPPAVGGALRQICLVRHVQCCASEIWKPVDRVERLTRRFWTRVNDNEGTLPTTEVGRIRWRRNLQGELVKILISKAATSWYFWVGENDCNLLLGLTTKHDFENFGGGICLVFHSLVAGLFISILKFKLIIGTEFSSWKKMRIFDRNEGDTRWIFISWNTELHYTWVTPAGFLPPGDLTFVLTRASFINSANGLLCGPIGVARGGRGPWPHKIFGISHSHFVLWEAVSQTKYCCSPKIKRFGPPKILGWLRHCVTPSWNNRSELLVVCSYIPGLWCKPWGW